MNPPFYGAKHVTDIDIDEIYPLIDMRSLFVGRWQFKRTKATETAYQEVLKQKAYPAFEDWKKRCKDEKILEPKVAYGYFSVEVLKCLSLPCLTDMSQGDQGVTPSLTPPHQGGGKKFIPLQLVTVGGRVVEKCHWLFAAHKYTDYLYLHGLAVESTEGLAEYWHKKILRELEIIPPLPPFTSAKQRGRFADEKGGRGGITRISPGYPVWPKLADQNEICKLLDAEKIGVTVTETYQLIPEYTSSAMILVE